MCSASNLANSVLPEPVGPTNRNDPIGLFNALSPAYNIGDWCEFCVQGKASSHPHKKRQVTENEVPVISMDYMGLKQREPEESRQMETPCFNTDPKSR